MHFPLPGSPSASAHFPGPALSGLAAVSEAESQAGFRPRMQQLVGTQ